MVAYAVSTDDAEYMPTSVVINGASCHTMHHLYFNYNYGQFTTAWDRLAERIEKPRAMALWKAGNWMGRRRLEINSIEMDYRRGRVLYSNVPV